MKLKCVCAIFKTCNNFFETNFLLYFSHPYTLMNKSYTDKTRGAKMALGREPYLRI